MDYDFCIIGGGIVGLATAMAIQQRWPECRLALVEKEAELGLHQSGHNSGVIHSGIYYPPGSLKAKLCHQGEAETKAFCRQHNIDYVECGKLIVATTQLELERLKALAERAEENQVSVRWLTRDELIAQEPNITGLAALEVHSTGIVDYRQVCEQMGRQLVSAGAKLHLGHGVNQISSSEEGNELTFGQQSLSARYLVACAGLQSDRIARLAGLKVSHKIIPFRGEYYRLPAEKAQLVNKLIYPVPDPDLPFLGIHLTRMVDGSITLGPNAVLGFSREGYRKGAVRLDDIADYLGFSGFWRLLKTHFQSALHEFANSLIKTRYLRQCQKYCPSLTKDDLQPYPAGIRAQAVLKDGSLVHDFLFLEAPRMLHVCNAPSPAATSAIPIGRMIADKLAEQCEL
ncbi:L-2-hydroxyglutarate oxidase [Vibrio sp. WXL103]|uniref:L-2-hydroxyglutarate oxidase n=1 Tax=Vibrio sp. WXL103 TaxID=3450710 RepID=UPI003EC69168